jgi:hypothetical protein
MDASNAPSRDLVSGDYQALLHTFYATIDNQARRRGKPEPSDCLTDLLNPEMMEDSSGVSDGGITFIPQSSFANQVAGSILDAGRRALQDHAEGISRFVTVSAPTGSSKSSFAWCLVASLVKTYPDVSVVFACETMQQCEETYWGIHEAMEIAESLTNGSVGPLNSQRAYGKIKGQTLRLVNSQKPRQYYLRETEGSSKPPKTSLWSGQVVTIGQSRWRPSGIDWTTSRPPSGPAGSTGRTCCRPAWSSAHMRRWLPTLSR